MAAVAQTDRPKQQRLSERSAVPRDEAKGSQGCETLIRSIEQFHDMMYDLDRQPASRGRSSQERGQ